MLPLLMLAQQDSQSNRHFWHQTQTQASPAEIWEVWTDVAHWQDWDKGLRSAQLEGAFTEGAKGSLIALNGRKTAFEIIACEPGQSYTFRSKLPLGALYVKRTLSQEAGQTTFKHEVWFSGFSAPLFAKILGPDFREVLPEVLDTVKQIAENK